MLSPCFFALSPIRVGCASMFFNFCKLCLILAIPPYPHLLSAVSSAACASDMTPWSLGLSEEVNALLLGGSHRRELKSGEQLFAYGSAPNAMFGLLSGSVRVSVTSRSGNEFVLSLLEPGHWFGEVSLFDELPRAYEARAASDSTIAILPAAAFKEIIEKHPEVHLTLTRLICHRLRLALTWIDDAVLMPMSTRLAKHIFVLLQSGSASGTQRVIPLTQEDLASKLGVSRQSVSRLLKLWEKDGVVSVDYGRITVLDMAALERLIQA